MAGPARRQSLTRGNSRLGIGKLIDLEPLQRAREIEGQAVKSAAKLGVARVEALGIEMPMYDITTGTGDFIANGVISHNCYARPTHEYLGLGAGTDFERKITVKPEAPRLLREAFERPRDRKSTRLNSSHSQISYAVFCLKTKRDQSSLSGARRAPSS